MWESLQPELNPQHTHENSHGLQAFHLRVLRKGFPPEGKLQKPPTDPFRWEGIQVQHLQQSVSPGDWGRGFLGLSSYFLFFSLHDFLHGDHRSFNGSEHMLLAGLETLLSSPGLGINAKIMNSRFFFMALNLLQLAWMCTRQYCSMSSLIEKVLNRCNF